jgi:hypothetical protein
MGGRVLDRPGDLADTARLLFDVFHAPQFRDTRYLDWYYRQNPLGPAIETDYADDQGLLGHMAGIPHVYHSSSGELPAMFPLDIAVHERARGQGVMAKMTAACYAETERRWGSALLTGMPNANSTQYYTTKGGFRLVTPMPVKICPSAWPEFGRTVSQRVSAAYLASSDFEALYASLDLDPEDGWCEKYTLPVLRWRLSRPDTDYRIHAGKEVVIVTSTDSRYRIPFTIVLKTFRRRSAASKRPSANGVIAAACRNRKTPLAVYSGFSSRTRVHGAPLPERLKPSPLNLVIGCRPPGFLDLARLEYSTYEFLEFDAY